MYSPVTVKTLPPASIECNGFTIIARKITPQLPIKNLYSKIKGPTLYRYKLELNCETHIVKELSPKIAIIDEKSMLNLDDGLKGSVITGLSTTMIGMNKAKLVNASGRHKANRIKINNVFLYAKLTRAIKGQQSLQAKVLK